MVRLINPCVGNGGWWLPGYPFPSFRNLLRSWNVALDSHSLDKVSCRYCSKRGVFAGYPKLGGLEYENWSGRIVYYKVMQLVISKERFLVFMSVAIIQNVTSFRAMLLYFWDSGIQSCGLAVFIISWFGILDILIFFIPTILFHTCNADLPAMFIYHDKL